MRESFKLWLKHLRTDIRLCMLVPMETVIGLPVEIRPGEAYLIPFLRSDAARRSCYPPVAYVCISYPNANILRFQDLTHDYCDGIYDRNNPVRFSIDGSYSFDYYDYLGKRICAVSGYESNPDEVLMECVKHCYEGMTDVYSLLIREKNNYLERNRNE